MGTNHECTQSVQTAQGEKGSGAVPHPWHARRLQGDLKCESKTKKAILTLKAPD